MRYSDPLPIERDGEAGTCWFPLTIHSALANTVDDISSNIEANLERDYIPFNGLVGKSSGAVAIVGSGPSLKANWQRLRKFKGDILACNAACQFLLERDIVPKYMMCFDADPLTFEFFTPHPDITYLIASRCPPRVFDMLEGCRIVCWHAAGDENCEALLQKAGKMEPMVIGGTAAVTRAMILVLPMGYTSIHLYGADSSFLNGDTHIRKSTTEERRMAIMVNGRKFSTAPWMCQQAEDFKILAPRFAREHGIEYVVHGDGLIPHLAMTMGFETDLEPKLQFLARAWGARARELWRQL